MSSTLHISLYLLLHMLRFGTIVRDVKISEYRVRNPPKQFKDKTQNLNAQENLREITGDAPTFFRRQDKDGKIRNAFQQDTWIQRKPSGNMI